MIKETLENNGQGKLNDKKISILKENFPNCFTGDTFDIEKFKKEINQELDFSSEGYELNFLGKNYAKFIADSIDTETVLVPNIEHNSKPENQKSENIYITGDNLDVLKHLRKSYSNKIKMIYIDPPYNTGGDDFVYRDNFKFTKEKLQEVLDIEEQEAERIINMTSSNSSSHSAWLTFMYPRLYIARELLKDSGVIIISIDDNEQAQLKMLCDDIFGEENEIGMFIINSSPSAIDYGHIANMHEYALFYSKSSLDAETHEIPDKDKEFKYTDELGEFNIYPLYNGNVAFNPETRPNLYYPFYLNPNKKLDNDFYEISLDKKEGWIEVYPVVSRKDGIQRVWRWGKQKSEEGLNKEIVGYITDSGEYRVVQKTRLTGKMIRSLHTDTAISSRRGTSEVEKLFGKKVFSFPKAVELIRRFVTAGAKDNDIVLDFFSGSSTTAHAVMKQNAEDGGNRKFILVQLDETVSKDSVAGKEGFKTIDEIGRERIIRAAKQIKEETQADLDYGFKHFYAKVLDENIIDQIADFDPNLLATQLEVEFDKETILTTWMNRDGHGLTPSVEEINLSGYHGYSVDNYLYLLDKGLTQQHIDTLLSKIVEDKKFNPTSIVVYGYNFTDFNILTQLETNLKQLRNEEKNIEVSLIKRY
ncbi:site-specific DNA-methyltransferase [Amphibacillus sediminis]|uniref:site-specific DNA-methyltransferase n=1 Tax=Amphibacillus sediminis TaxID=360185 RepID=UPI0008336EDE|nr:site-specific DNA-methyltransferase [Amphibacillus sediminis]